MGGINPDPPADEPPAPKTAKEAAQIAGAAVNFRGTYAKYAGSRAPEKGSAAEAELIAAERMGFRGKYGNLPIRISRGIEAQSQAEQRQRDPARWILGDPGGSYQEGVREVTPVSSQMEGERPGDVLYFDVTGKRVAEFSPSKRPGYYPLEEIGDRETQAELEASPEGADRYARMGIILEAQRQRAYETPTTLDDYFFLNELAKWNRTGIETSSEYHALGRKLGVPIPANPFENWGDVALAFEKAGNKKDDIARNYAFNPNVGDLIHELPGGKGLQEVGWDMALSTYRGLPMPGRVSFAAAVGRVSAARNYYGPYGLLWGGRNDVITQTPTASEWAIDATARTAIEAKFLEKDIFPQNYPIPGSPTERFAFDEYGRVLRPGGTFEPVYSAAGVPFNKKMGRGEYVYVGEYQYDTGETVSRFYEKNVGSFVDFDEFGMAGVHFTGIRSGGGPSSFYETNLPPVQKLREEVFPGIYITGVVDTIRQGIIPSASAMSFDDIAGKSAEKNLPRFDDYYESRVGDYNKRLDTFNKKLDVYNQGGMKDQVMYKALMREEVALTGERNLLGVITQAKSGLELSRFAMEINEAHQPPVTTQTYEEFQTSQGKFATAVNTGFFQKVPILADINKAGRAFQLESKIGILTKQLNEKYDTYTKSGVISAGPAGAEFRGTQKQLTGMSNLENNIRVLQNEYDKISSSLVGGFKHTDIPGGLTTRGFYEFMHEKSQWYTENVSEPFSTWTLNAAENTGGGKFFEQVTGLGNTGPLRGFIPFYSPRITAEAASGFVKAPGMATEFIGMAPLGFETVVRHPATLSALVVAGIAMQGRGIWEGFAGPRPVEFATEQAGMIAAFHYAGEGIRVASPINFARVEIPTTTRGLSTTYYTMLSKMPFSRVESGGTPLAGVATVGKYKLSFETSVPRITLPETSPFLGRPTSIVRMMGFRTGSPVESLHPWSRGQHAILDDFLISNLPRKQAAVIQTVPGAIDAVYSRLYVPEQLESFGMVPSQSASRGTIAAISRVWGDYGRRMRVGGSRALRAFAGEGARYESLFDSDYDTYVDRNYMPEIYRRTLTEVEREYPNAANVMNPAKGGGWKPGTFLGRDQTSITTVSGEEFFHTKPFEVYPYMIERETTSIRAVGGATVESIRPQLMLKRKIAAMVESVEMEPYGTPRLITARVKDIADAYSLSRAASRTLYRGTTVDVAGTITGMKVSRATALEAFSDAARDYVDVLPEVQRTEALGYFREMRVDLLEGVNRNPVPAYDLATGQGLVAARYKPVYQAVVGSVGTAVLGVSLGIPQLAGVAGVIFPGMKGGEMLKLGEAKLTSKGEYKFDFGTKSVWGRSMFREGGLYVPEAEMPKAMWDFTGKGRRFVEELYPNVVGEQNLGGVPGKRGYSLWDVSGDFVVPDRSGLYPVAMKMTGKNVARYPLFYKASSYLPAMKMVPDLYQKTRRARKNEKYPLGIYPAKVISPSLYPNLVVDVGYPSTSTPPGYPGIITDIGTPTIDLLTPDYPASPPTVTTVKYPGQPKKPDLYPIITFTNLTVTETPPVSSGGKKFKTRRRKQRKNPLEWYIWNQVPTMESVWGYALNIKEVMPKTTELKFKMPRVNLKNYKI